MSEVDPKTGLFTPKGKIADLDETALRVINLLLLNAPSRKAFAHLSDDEYLSATHELMDSGFMKIQTNMDDIFHPDFRFGVLLAPAFNKPPEPALRRRWGGRR